MKHEKMNWKDLDMFGNISEMWCVHVCWFERHNSNLQRIRAVTLSSLGGTERRATGNLGASKRPGASGILSFNHQVWIL